MDRKLLHKLLSAYLDGELGADDVRRIKRKIRKDLSLAGVYEELRVVRSTLSSLPSVRAPQNLVPQIIDVIKNSGETPVSQSDSQEFINELVHCPDDVLNAYVDGELEVNEERCVDEHLLRSQENRELVEDIEEVSSILSDLDQQKAPGDLVSSIVDEIRCNPEPKDLDQPLGMEIDQPDREKSPFTELLSAYLDGEVTLRRRRSVEKRLDSSRQCREILDDYAAVRLLLSDLPQEKAPPTILENVLDVVRIDDALSQESVAFAGHGDSIDRHFYTDRTSSNWFRTLRSAALFAASVLFVWAATQMFSPTIEVGDPPSVASKKSFDVKPNRNSTAPNSLVADSARQKGSQTNDGVSPPNTIERRIPERPDVVDRGDRKIPADRLHGIDAGEVASVLNGRQINLSCIDVEEAYKRVHVILMDKFDVETSPTEERNNQTGVFVVNIATTPEHLSEILESIWHAERHGIQLISEVDISAQSNQSSVREVVNVDNAAYKFGPPVVPTIEKNAGVIAADVVRNSSEQSTASKKAKAKSAVSKSLPKSEPYPPPVTERPTNTAATPIPAPSVRVRIVIGS